MMEANVVKSMVQCPFCFAIPTKLKFYSCKNSHKICEHCWKRLATLAAPNKDKKNPNPLARQKCPMGDCFYTDPPFRNLEVEEMIRNYELEVNCVYYHDGCQVTGVRAEMEEHEKKCGCREVPCPNSECAIKLQLRLLFPHIKEAHKESVVKDEKESNGEIEEFSLCCLLKEEFELSEVSTWITIIWNHRTGQTFFPMFEKRRGAWYTWIFVQGNQEEANRWQGVVRIRSPDGRAVLEFKGPVFPIDMSGKDVMSGKEQCLALSDRQVDMMKIEGVREDEKARGFSAKIIVTYDVLLVEEEQF